MTGRSDRLPRPPIPIEVKCRVAMRQLGEMWPDTVIAAHHRKHGALLKELLTRLAALLGCEISDLRLDHEPALGVRGKSFGHHGRFIDYIPPANDPNALIYREKHAHHIKTNVAGDHGQFSDTVLMKRERKRIKKAAARAVPSETPRSASRAKFTALSGVKLRTGKRKWAKGRKIQSKNNLRRKRK